MNKMLVYWIASSSMLFFLSFVYFRHNLYRKNALFAWWLYLGVFMQIASAYCLLFACPVWLYKVWPFADECSYALAACVLVVAFIHRSRPVNQILLYGLGAMVAFSLAVRWFGNGLSLDLRGWLLNIAFFGPALFMLLAFSNVGIDRLPLYVDSFLRQLNSDSAPSQELAFRGVANGPSAHAA